MGQTARFQETLRRLAMIDEGFVVDEARLGVAWSSHRRWIPGRRRCCRWGCRWRSVHRRCAWKWGAGRVLAAGASEDEIADVLLAIAPVVGLGRIVAAAPEGGDRSDMT